jgi:hypothetical protein
MVRAETVRKAIRRVNAAEAKTARISKFAGEMGILLII